MIFVKPEEAVEYVRALPVGAEILIELSSETINLTQAGEVLRFVVITTNKRAYMTGSCCSKHNHVITGTR